MHNIVVCASGGGGNFRALFEASFKYNYKIIALVVDRECAAIEYANVNNIQVIRLKNVDGKKNFSSLVSLAAISELLVLAGFISIIPDEVITAFDGRAINTHPSLLPKYGGKGMIGENVQSEVLKHGEIYGGCSVHFITQGIDEGDVILQTKIKIDKRWSAYQLGGKIHSLEKFLLPYCVNLILNGDFIE